MYLAPAAYLERFERSLDEAISAGFVLAPEGDVWRQDAAGFAWS